MTPRVLTGIVKHRCISRHYQSHCKFKSNPRQSQPSLKLFQLLKRDWARYSMQHTLTCHSYMLNSSQQVPAWCW